MNHLPGTGDRPTVTKTRDPFNSIRQLTCIDWLKLVASFLIPFLLGFGTIILSMQQSDLSQRNRLTDLDIANRKSEQDAQIAIANAEENTLNAYKREMWGLIDEELTNDVNGRFTFYRGQATRALTLSAMRQFSDLKYKREIIQFLYDMHILRRDRVLYVDLTDADLTHVNFDGLHLPNIKLDGARLMNTSWIDSELAEAHLQFSDLRGSNFTRCKLNRTIFIGAWLSDSDFQGAYASGVSFGVGRVSNVNFRRAKLNGASFYGANVTGTNFEQAILLDSSLNNDQLFKQAKSLKGALLPNGSLMQN